MRLITIKIAGYRRFKYPTTINFDGKLIALVGPNEAGKSTILEAARRVGDTDPVSIQERTRATTPDDGSTAVEALWLLEDADLEAMSVHTAPIARAGSSNESRSTARSNRSSYRRCFATGDHASACSSSSTRRSDSISKDLAMR